MKFLLLTTGGTVASVPSDQGLAPAIPGEKLFEACPLLTDFDHDVEISDLFSKDSSNMDPLDWLRMAEAVRRRGADIDAAVLLHGTDTMAWSAAALSFLLSGVSAPVVFTGSMLPPGKPGSDAPDNLYAAFQFALQLAMYKRKGVSVAFDGLLIHGPRATKADSRRKRAFLSAEYPLLGEMRDRGSHKTAWLTPKVPALAGSRPWGDSPEFETDIAIVPVFPGMRAASLDAVVAAAPKAVVLEGFGLGGIPNGRENLLPSIRRGIGLGIPFVLRTQVPFGGTDPFVYEVGRRALDLGMIDARDMTREALTVKLMLLLPLAGKEKLEERLHAGLCDEVARL
jgi:L-asparaginase